MFWYQPEAASASFPPSSNKAQTMRWPLLSIAYPPEQAGFWSPVTSTLNWCEEDYYATVYLAEIVNALTNLMFMWLGIRGILSCRRNKHDQVFLVALCGYLLVGTGSFLFHSTLKYSMQLVDELSMIYTTCLMCYASFSYSRPTGVRVVLGVVLAALSVFITLYYHYIQDPLFHQNAYAILTAIVIFRSMYTMEVTLRPRWRRSTEPERRAREKKGLPVLTKERQRQENDRDLDTLNTMWLMVFYGLTMFLGGFLFWNLDNGLCGTLRRWRRAVGLPWGIILEGHGWWHIMTGIGAYLYIVWGIWLRHCLNKKQDEYHVRWVRFWHIPEIIRIQQSTQSSGDSLGQSKKTT